MGMCWRMQSLVGVLLVWSGTSWALPWYAVEEGVSCATCHTNPTGAGKRNATGGHDQTEALRLAWSARFAPKGVHGRLNDWIAVGADLRVQNQTTMGTPRTNTSTLPQGSLYVEANAGKHLTFYSDYDVANTLSREVFGLVHHLPGSLWMKVGRMNLPYGLRIADATSPIRANLNQSFANQDIGMEVGSAPGPFEFAVAVSNGVPGGVGDENLAKAVTASAAWIAQYGRLGTSVQWNRRPTVELLSTGVHGGAKWGPVVWLGEVDLQRSTARGGGGVTTLLAAYSAIHWRIVDGLYATLLYDLLEPNRSIGGDVQHRIGGGMDLFPLPRAKLSTQYRHNRGPGAANDDQITVQAHLFF
jgi:hypothetical protein